MGNESEIETWNSLVAERWVLFQEGLDARIRVFGEHVLARAGLRAGMRVLDVGCGCADLLIGVAGAVGPSGKVVGVDVSRPMLARARERVRDLPHAELIEADASVFVPDMPFDALVSRFGVMFFDEPGPAFVNLRRAMKPAGTLSFACWQSLAVNPWAMVPLSAVRRAAPAPPPAASVAPAGPPAPGPFAFADPDYLREVLAGAGWTDVALTPLTHPMLLGGTLEEAVEYASRIGPTARVLREADEATRAHAKQMLREALEPLAPDFALDGAVWLVTARA